MEYLTHSLIKKTTALEIVQKLKDEKSSWQDGKKTAGSYAAKIKNNFQLDKRSLKILLLIKSSRILFSKVLLCRI